MDSQTDVKPLSGHRTALTLLVMAYTLSIMDRMILSVLFPSIQAEFGVSDTQLGLLGGLTFALFYATLGVPIARWADQYNRKVIILVSLFIFSVMTALSGLATGFIMLLLLRIGVGIGEAGVNPASQSIVADYFPPQRRAFAMAILMLGANFGMMLGFAGGGYVAQEYGWRVALYVVGAPGILLTVVMWLLFREPPRGSFEQAEGKASPPPIRQTIAVMWASPAMRHLVAAGSVSGMLTYGLGQWLPTFFMRAHDLPQAKVGAIMAVLFGLIGVVGVLVSGKLADRLSHRGFQYSVWMVAITQLIAVPFFIAAPLVGELKLVVALFVIPAFVGNFYLGPSLALVQTLSPVHMRAVSAAVYMLCLNLIGLGLGPLLIGVLSDLLAPAFGDSALNVALGSFSVIMLWAALHFYLCGRALKANPVRND